MDRYDELELLLELFDRVTKLPAITKDEINTKSEAISIIHELAKRMRKQNNLHAHCVQNCENA